jgi:hypothetical protein
MGEELQIVGSAKPKAFSDWVTCGMMKQILTRDEGREWDTTSNLATETRQECWLEVKTLQERRAILNLYADKVLATENYREAQMRMQRIIQYIMPNTMSSGWEHVFCASHRLSNILWSSYARYSNFQPMVETASGSSCNVYRPDHHSLMTYV